MRLPTKRPFVHIRWSDGAQVLFHCKGRSKAARGFINAIAQQSADMASRAFAVEFGPAAFKALYFKYGRAIQCPLNISDADATSISREVSRMMAEGRAESGEGR